MFTPKEYTWLSVDVWLNLGRGADSRLMMKRALVQIFDFRRDLRWA